MSKTGSIRTLFVLAGLSLLTGCIRSPLKKNIQLKPIHTEKATYEKTIDQITLQAQVFSKRETKKVLGTALKNTDVIQITVTNNTPIAYELKKQHVDLELLSNRFLAQGLNTFNRKIEAIALPTVSVVIALPSLVGCIAGAVKHSPTLVIASVTGGLGIATLSRQAISRATKKAHKNTYSFLRNLSAENLPILPSKTESMLLFIDTCAVPYSFHVGLCPMGTPNVTHNFTVIL